MSSLYISFSIISSIKKQEDPGEKRVLRKKSRFLSKIGPECVYRHVDLCIQLFTLHKIGAQWREFFYMAMERKVLLFCSVDICFLLKETRVMFFGVNLHTHQAI